MVVVRSITFKYVLFFRLLAYHSGQCLFVAVWKESVLESGVRGERVYHDDEMQYFDYGYGGVFDNDGGIEYYYDEY